MPALLIRLSETELAKLHKLADSLSLPTATWARSELMRLVKAAEPPAPKPFVKAGPKKEPLEVWLTRFAEADKTFPSGQLYFRHIPSNYRLCPEMWDDERAHALCQEDIIPQRGGNITPHPKLHAY